MISVNPRTAMDSAIGASLGEDIWTAGGTVSALGTAGIYSMKNPEIAPTFTHRAPAIKGHDI